PIRGWHCVPSPREGLRGGAADSVFRDRAAGATLGVPHNKTREGPMAMSLRNCRRVVLALAGGALVALAQPALAQNLKYKPISVKTPDGLTISAQEWGNPNGPEILFIHGFSQSHMSWMRQVDSDLAKEFRIITYDLRGHGNSDKPFDPARYRDNKAWADEVQAVIDTAALKRPVLVGWSYAARVISDNVTHKGAAKIAGINFVDASIKANPEFVGDNLKTLPLMASEDRATNIKATRDFVRGCFEKQPTAEDYEIMLAFNMMVPPKVRDGLGSRPLDATEGMSKLNLPVLVTHGREDRTSKLGNAEYTAKTIPGAKLSIYDGIGHAPFYEDAARFNSELTAFVRAAASAN